MAGSNGWITGGGPDRPSPLARGRTSERQREPGGRRPCLRREVPAPESPEDRRSAPSTALRRDFNNADTKALAARFTEDAEVHEEDGSRFQGRALIEEWLAETLAANKGAELAIEIETIRVLSPDVVKGEGRTTVTSAKGEPPRTAGTRCFWSSRR